MKISLAFLCLLLASCKTKPEMVNSSADLPLRPFVGPLTNASYAQVVLEGNSSPTIEALSGRVLLQSEMPIPLSHVQLGLYQITADEKKLILEFTSDSDGSFHITRPIKKAVYVLASLDKRFEGSLTVSLLEHPVQNLILEVKKRSSVR